MTLNRFSIAAPLALIFMSSIVHAESPDSLGEFYKFFKSGQYPKALTSLQTLNDKENTAGTKAYLSGLSYARMQEYDKAVTQFDMAINEKNQGRDLYYEYGQALFATNELKKAREAFKTSVEKGFSTAASLYYVAHISQILEDNEMAKDYYLKVLKDKSADKKMQQIARFQLSETLLSIAREKSLYPEDITRRVERYVLPMLSNAYELDQTSPVATDINQRKTDIMTEFKLDPNLLNNGRRISPKRYDGYVSQKIRHDDNVSLVNEENNIQQTKKESFIFETEAYGNYEFVADKRFLIIPEARMTYTKHSNQTDPEVYQNDSFVLDMALKNKYEHTVNNLPASFLFDVEYTHTLKDWQAQKKMELYANATTLGIGESLSYFNFGDTTFRLKRKSFVGASEAISNHTTTLSADQTIFLPIQHLIVALFEADFIDNFNNPTTNTNTYLLRFDYIIPEIMPTYTLALALATTMTDTLEQKSTRGSELMVNPSIDFSKNLSDKSKISLTYDYTKSNSDDPNYAYKKNVFTTEYRYSF